MSPTDWLGAIKIQAQNQWRKEKTAPDGDGRHAVGGSQWHLCRRHDSYSYETHVSVFLSASVGFGMLMFTRARGVTFCIDFPPDKSGFIPFIG